MAVRGALLACLLFSLLTEIAIAQSTPPPDSLELDVLVYYLKDRPILKVFERNAAGDFDDNSDAANSIRDLLRAQNGVFTVTYQGTDADNQTSQQGIDRYQISEGGLTIRRGGAPESASGFHISIPGDYIRVDITIHLDGLTDVVLKGVYREEKEIKVVMPLAPKKTEHDQCVPDCSCARKTHFWRACAAPCRRRGCR